MDITQINYGPFYLAPFSNISLNGSCQLEIQQGIANEVISVTCPNPQFFVSNSTLYVNGSGKITVAINTLKKLDLNGSCKVTNSGSLSAIDMDIIDNGSSNFVTLTNLNIGNILTVSENGSSNLYFSGSTNKLDLTVNGSPYFGGYGLISNNCDINTNGSQKIEVYVNNILNIKINGSGNVYYKGNPPFVSTTYNGSGRAIPQ